MDQDLIKSQSDVPDYDMIVVEQIPKKLDLD